MVRLFDKNKKFRSVNKSLYGIHVDFDSDDDYVPQQRLLYTNKDKKNYSLMDTGTFIQIIAWKLTKNRSHIISDISIPGRLPHSGFSQRFKLNTNSPNMSDKDKQLLYSLIERLLFICKVTKPDIHDYVSYIITRMKSPTICHKNGHLQTMIQIKRGIN